MAINFNGVEIPNFVKVNNIVNSILPPINQNQVKMIGRAGTYDFGNEFNPRMITVAITVIANDTKDLRTKVRELADWLYYEEAKEFVVLDEPDKHYLAKITENTDLSEILHVGQGQLSFICTDPFAYGEEKEFFFNPTEPIAYPFYNDGGTDTYPKMKFEFTQNSTEFAVVTDEEFLSFGKPLNITSEVAKDIQPLVFHDDMSSLTGWTTGINADGANLDGTFKTNGYSFSLDNLGTGTGWHGAGAIKSLSTPIQDFKIRLNTGFLATHSNQLGRVELYLLDINGQEFGKIALKDVSNTQYAPKAEARAGKFGTGNYFVSDFGSYVGVWRKWNSGIMEISRKGNKWTAYFAIIGSNGEHHTRLTRSWIDNSNAFMSQLASIQIHIGTYKEYTPINTMWIGDVKVWNYSPELAENEVPIIFKQGDVLEIDNETGMVLLNGFPYYENLDPASRFIKFKKGDNGITVSPANITINGELRYKERWL